MTSAQRSSFETSWVHHGLKLTDGMIDIDTLFGRTGMKALEIGFGMGDSLLEMAIKQPQVDFIGIEVHTPGVGSLINAARMAGIKNLRVYCADAIDVLKECIPCCSIDRVQLYFPDPWHKKKAEQETYCTATFSTVNSRKTSNRWYFAYGN
jgi:tRNA (guanine-N7-)-methyltransferase